LWQNKKQQAALRNLVLEACSFP